MSSTYKVITPPTTEPVTIDYVKSWLRVDWDDDNMVIGSLISQARSLAETVTHRAFCTQTIQQIDVIERPVGGELSGAITPGASFYQFQESLGANPFGSAQYYYDLSMPPIQKATPVVIETRTTAFDTWQTFAQTTNPDGSTNTYLDDTREPARLYVRDPLVSNFYRFTYKCGYDPATYPLLPDLQQCLMSLISYYYDNRDGQDIPDALMQKLLSKRVDWV